MASQMSSQRFDGQLFAGIDGGGTKTRAVIANRQGEILGLGVAGPSSLAAASHAMRCENIGSAIQSALAPKGLEADSLASLFLGVASVATKADCNTVREAVDELGWCWVEHVNVDHDIRIALEGGLAGREGIALIAGTGSSCYGRRHDGQAWQAGGWEHLLDDAGSGYDLAIQGLRAVVRASRPAGT
jgi:N-acetylglucosamine kinase-like BadF-type ATPase